MVEESNYNDIFQKILKFENECYEIYMNNNFDKEIFSNQKPLVIVISGIEELKLKLNEENKSKMGEFFTN